MSVPSSLKSLGQISRMQQDTFLFLFLHQYFMVGVSRVQNWTGCEEIGPEPGTSETEQNGMRNCCGHSFLLSIYYSHWPSCCRRGNSFCPKCVRRTGSLKYEVQDKGSCGQIFRGCPLVLPFCKPQIRAIFCDYTQ